MTTDDQTGVVAIWNRDLTLQICLGADLDQGPTDCECPQGNNCMHDEQEERCKEVAWPGHGAHPSWDAPIVVCGDGQAHFCGECVYHIDPAFVRAYEQAFWAAQGIAGITTGHSPSLDEWMDALAAQFPPELCLIRRGPREK